MHRCKSLAQYVQFTFDGAVEAAASDSAVLMLGPFALVDDLGLHLPSSQVNIWFPKLAGDGAGAHSLSGQDVTLHLKAIKPDRIMTAVTGVTQPVHNK